MTDAKAIAEGLSEAQKQALVNARDLMSNHGGYAFMTVVFDEKEPWPKGICQFLTLTNDRLTPLGLEVRAYLIGETL